jgi:type I restriction enzyme R subunit
MVFYAGKIILQPDMENPTLVLLTDRNDLDNQLFDNFVIAQDLLRQKPVQAETREHLRELLKVASGGIVFTTIQKFIPENGERFPLLSNRRNIVVIADEAHRSQYDFIDGLARNMRDALPNASFIGFTDNLLKRPTAAPSVFGNYSASTTSNRQSWMAPRYDIFYESRLAKLELKKRKGRTSTPSLKR